MNIPQIFASSLLLQIGTTLVPVLLWAWWFQRKNKERRVYVVMSFLAGMVSVIPIKLYQRYWDDALLFFEHTNVFIYMEELLEIGGMSTLLSYVTIHGLVAILIFFFVLILMGILELSTHGDTIKSFVGKAKKAAESPLFYITIGTLIGFIAFGVSFSLEQTVWFFVIVGAMEEYVKHLCLRMSDGNAIKTTNDAVSYAIIVALGFAFVENILYFRDYIDMVRPGNTEFFWLFTLRSTVSVLAHVCFSAIFGYFYGQAMFAKELCNMQYKGCMAPVFLWIQRVFHLRKDVAYHDGKMFEGLVLAMILHAIFNLLLEHSLYPILLPFLIGMYLFVMSLFHRKKMYISTPKLNS